MDIGLIFFLPFVIVGFGVMLAPFISRGWPDGLTHFVEFCVSIGNGIWVAGVVLLILISVGLPLSAAAVASWPVMFIAGRYFNRLSEEWDTTSNDIKRKGWEERQRREKEEGSDR